MPDDDETESPDPLESPESVEALYHGRGADIQVARPFLTGDVFSQIDIPGLGDDSGLAIVLTHPCSMRKDGVHLADRIMVARVRNNNREVPLARWPHYDKKIMPLPGLGVDGMPYAAAFFVEASLCSSDQLVMENRIACLSEAGINLLQQRFVFHITRFAVPTRKLHATAAHVFREIELHEEWMDGELVAGGDPQAAAYAFHEWIRSVPDGGTGESRQQRLSDPQQVASIRRELRNELANRRRA